MATLQNQFLMNNMDNIIQDQLALEMRVRLSRIPHAVNSRIKLYGLKTRDENKFNKVKNKQTNKTVNIKKQQMI